MRREENELQEIRRLKFWDSSAIKRDARLARQCNNIRQSTFYVSSLAAEADVVEASYGEAAVLIRLCKLLLLPPHEDVGAVFESATPDQQRMNCIGGLLWAGTICLLLSQA